MSRFQPGTARASVLPLLIGMGLAFVVSNASGQQPRTLTWFDPPSADEGEPLLETGIYDPSVRPAEMLQPALSTQPGTAAPQPARRPARGAQQANVRLASVPNMFGDFAMLTATADIFVQNPNGQPIRINSNFGLPTAGAVRTGKISENDTPIPVDRVFFSYNHFNNLFQVNESAPFPPGGPGVMRQEPFDRYTIGFEKTLLDGLFSVELRLPFNGTYDINLQSTGINGGNIGNLAVVIKSLLYSDERLAVGAGMAIGTPTGSDTVVRLGQNQLRFRNEATHLLPYIGFIYSPGDPTWGWGSGLFLTGFAQVDLAASGNPVEVGPLNEPTAAQVGTFTEQNLAFFDIAVGYWLYRDPAADRLTGLAAVTEFHYTTAVQDSDVLGAAGGGSGVVLRNPFNRFDIVDFTVGVQALLFDASSLRVGYAFPLGLRDDQRLFDSEVQVQFNRRF